MHANESTYRLCAVGDICLSDHPLRSGYGIGSRAAQMGVEGLLGSVAEILADSDDSFANLETAVAEKISGDKPFLCEEHYLTQLASCGFTLLSVANNHSLDHGSSGFDNTVRLLQARQLPALGVADADGSCIPVIRQHQNISVCWLAYNTILKPRDNYPYATLTDMSKVTAHISVCREQFDHVIVSCHWGLELMKDAPAQIKFAARAMVDAGASLILGHHPHVTQEFERYGAGVIAYSLGDFLLDLDWCEASKSTAILRVELLKDRVGNCDYVKIRRNANLQLEAQGVENIPVVAHSIKPINENIDLTNPRVFGDAYLQRYRRALIKNQISKSVFLLKNLHRFGIKRLFALFAKKVFG